MSVALYQQSVRVRLACRCCCVRIPLKHDRNEPTKKANQPATQATNRIKQKGDQPTDRPTDQASKQASKQAIINPSTNEFGS